jgi:uncharacterized protein
MIISRLIENQILNNITPNKVILILGARRTGKTVLLNELVKKISEPFIFLNGEDIQTIDSLSRRSIINYKNLMGNTKLLIIDEAQKIPDIGLILKLMIDNIEGLRIIVTGSSAFDLTSQTGEPLTGRKKTYHLFPLSENEFAGMEDNFSKKENLRERLIYGNYPELLQLKSREEKQQYLRELVSSYLFKDILSYENIKSSNKIIELLKLLSYQVGSEVSVNELSNKLGISKSSVSKYLDLLTKVFILFRLSGFSRNLRKEISKNSKWYFIDNGIRNAIIANFSPIESRNDIGSLWENYIIGERIKFQNYKPLISNNYFWRTYDQQEIDWLEERDGKLYATEFKWKETILKPPVAWRNSYPDSKFQLIHSDNYMEWIGI